MNHIFNLSTMGLSLVTISWWQLVLSPAHGGKSQILSVGKARVP